MNKVATESHPEEHLSSTIKIPIIRIFTVFLTIGFTVFGGMWAATQTLEKKIVHKEKWMSSAQLDSLLLASTLIPAPKFLGLSGLIGCYVRGWLGSLIAIMGLFIPPSILVLLGVVFVNPSLLNGPLAPLNHSIGIVVVGILFGNALRQLKGKKQTRRKWFVGVCLSIVIFISIIAGVPLIISAIAGFITGAFLIREGKKTKTKKEKEE